MIIGARVKQPMACRAMYAQVMRKCCYVRVRPGVGQVENERFPSSPQYVSH